MANTAGRCPALMGCHDLTPQAGGSQCHHISQRAHLESLDFGVFSICTVRCASMKREEACVDLTWNDATDPDFGQPVCFWSETGTCTSVENADVNGPPPPPIRAKFEERCAAGRAAAAEASGSGAEAASFPQVFEIPQVVAMLLPTLTAEVMASGGIPSKSDCYVWSTPLGQWRHAL